jgi:hypothetical protein
MKVNRYLLCLVFLVSPLLADAQRAAFGPFVIDSSTIGNLEVLLAATQTVILPYHDSMEMDYSGSSSHVYEISASQNRDRLPGPGVSFQLTAGKRLFYLDNLQMGQLLVTSMWLGYHDGVLQLLQCDAKVQLTLYIHEYYGKAQATERNITITCERDSVNPILRTVPQFYTEWPLVFGALASYTVGSYFDVNCNLQRYAVFRLENTNAD